jgi:recombination protein RecA
MKRTSKRASLSAQVKKRVSAQPKTTSEYEGNTERMISTGSTLLDLAISGGRINGGGIPSGILVEIFGPSGAGKTVLLCEIAGAIQRQEGQVMFHDPEARLNKQFARMFDLDTDDMNYGKPNTIPQVFKAVREWEPEGKNINGVFADSLAALSTDMEMGKDEGDKMGMRRPKEFSEELRKTCRILTQKKLLMVCSNQIRDNMDAGPYGQKYRSPGGHAIGFYSSLRLRAGNPTKIKQKTTVSGKEVTKVIGVKIEIEVFKSSIWKPYNKAPLTIIFDYGIDDVRENLQFIKDYTKNTVYTVDGEDLDKSINKAISIIEEEGLEDKLKEEVQRLWKEIESKFDSNRKKKQR